MKGQQAPVTCLGLQFPDDRTRREYFCERLRDHLAGESSAKGSGMPRATIDRILELSDPPYYTACPNPFLASAIEELGTTYADSSAYSRTPFAADVSEGKNDVVYNAHSYHTKVPHKAVARYILHFTDPGDVVLDGFCGTGMTGVAAQMCADEKFVRDLCGADSAHRVGRRTAILSDLSPAATFIAKNYNSEVDQEQFADVCRKVANDVESECGWMYETRHPRDGSVGRINYTVWSDVFSCPECAHEGTYWDFAVDRVAKKQNDAFDCPSCGSHLGKRQLERVWSNTIDNRLGQPLRLPKQIPVLINYSVAKSRFEKDPDSDDLELVKRIQQIGYPNDGPADRMIEGGESWRNDPLGMTHVHHYLTIRNYTVMAALIRHATATSIPGSVIQAVLDCLPVITKMSRFRVPAWFDKSTGPMKGWTAGTLYVPSLQGEQNVFNSFSEKVAMIKRSASPRISHAWINTGDSANLPLPDDSIDYIFLDPPFGSNLNYSELNFIAESWLQIFTSNETEAVENPAQGKDIEDYRRLIESCFSEAFRILKPGRWITIEFSNTKAVVWNAIQAALQTAGFVVANVSALDKKQGSFKAVNTKTAVKQDLVISAYKPNGGLEDRVATMGFTAETPWDFVQTHLKNLPIPTLESNSQMTAAPERDVRRIFDRMVSWFVRHGAAVPVSAAEFQSQMLARFPERDGMFFLPTQVDQYDRVLITAGTAPQREMFVDDERSAIEWLTDFLKAKPSSAQVIHPEFMQLLGAGWRKHEAKPEMKLLLQDNFIEYTGDGPVPNQVHSYLSSNWKGMRGLGKDDPTLRREAVGRWYVPDPTKQQDVEARREKALLREFDAYKAHKGKKMREIRLEVMRVGFKAAWAAKDYRTIIDVSAKVPDEVWQEDERLMMLHSMAETRLEAER
ncbi:MAG: DNA methylase [Spirochaetia bacterium]|nr:MAG: DNA methylase [Spirochaetia bacterium]